MTHQQEIEELARRMAREAGAVLHKRIGTGRVEETWRAYVPNATWVFYKLPVRIMNREMLAPRK